MSPLWKLPNETITLKNTISDERKIVSAPKSAGNNYSYPIVYDREMNFAIQNQSHSLKLRAVFHVCRFEDKNGVVRTKLNLNSVYPLGDIKKLAFKLWVNDMNSKTALTTNSSEKVKFDRLTDMLNGCDLHSVLKE